MLIWWYVICLCVSFCNIMANISVPTVLTAHVIFCTSALPYVCVHPSLGFELLMRVCLGCLGYMSTLHALARRHVLMTPMRMLEGQAPCPACVSVESIVHFMFDCPAVAAPAGNGMYDIIKTSVNAESRLRRGGGWVGESAMIKAKTPKEAGLLSREMCKQISLETCAVEVHLTSLLIISGSHSEMWPDAQPPPHSQPSEPCSVSGKFQQQVISASMQSIVDCSCSQVTRCIACYCLKCYPLLAVHWHAMQVADTGHAMGISKKCVGLRPVSDCS